jgi:hypothetical protein
LRHLPETITETPSNSEEGLIMNLPTKLTITGLGLAVLMLLAFLTPVDAQIA